jgi:DNA-binding NtrC family response regulator
LSLSAQAKILRVLQERVVDRVGGHKPIPVDVRIVAATNKNLEHAIKDRAFREDLFYRISVVRIQTPALSDIAQDIPVLANHFLAKHCAVMKVETKQFAPAAMNVLQNYSWPGNARQLENEVKRLVASVRGKTIGQEHVDLPSVRAQTIVQENTPSYEGKTIDAVVNDIERRMIQNALNKYHWNKQRAAQELGLSRQGLVKKLKRLAITR